MGGGAWPFLVGGVICLVNSVNERDPSLLNNHANDYSLAMVSRGTCSIKLQEDWGNNRSVMPLDVLNRTRITLTHSTSINLGREAWEILLTCVVIGIDYCNY